MGRSLLGWLAFGVLVAVAVATAGWGSGPDAARPAARRDAVHSSRLTPAAAARLTRDVDLLDRDVPAGLHGTALRELTVCGAEVGPQGVLGTHGRSFAGPGGRRVRTEVVAFAPGRADAALAALREAALPCTRPVPPGPTELPSTLALDVTARRHGPGRHDLDRELVVERRGDVLVLLVVRDRPARRTAGRAPFTVDLARVLAARLLFRLPDRLPDAPARPAA